MVQKGGTIRPGCIASIFSAAKKLRFNWHRWLISVTAATKVPKGIASQY